MKLFAKTLFTGKNTLQNQLLTVNNGIITSIENTSASADADFTIENLAPGLLDVQIYSAGGSLFSDQQNEHALEVMEETLFAEGCTGFFATIATNTAQVFEQCIIAAKNYWPKRKGNFLGLHLEGPFLNEKRKGAHPAKLIRKAELNELKSWVELGEGVIKMITIAPELQDQEIIDYLNEQNIIISAGHSDASFDEAKSFFENIPAATHLFNAMPQMHHRQPGLIPAIFEKQPYTSVVADGIHVDFNMIKMAKRLLADKLFYITDAVTETNDGAYRHVFTGDRYTMPDGTLSGSCLTMLKCVQNGVERMDISIEESLRMASTIPSNLIKNKTYGYVNGGEKANLIGFKADFTHQISVLGDWVHTSP